MKKVSIVIAVAGLLASGQVFAQAATAREAAQGARILKETVEVKKPGATRTRTTAPMGAQRQAIEGAGVTKRQNVGAQKSVNTDAAIVPSTTAAKSALTCERPPTISSATMAIAARAADIGLVGSTCVQKFQDAEDKNIPAVAVSFQAGIGSAAVAAQIDTKEKVAAMDYTVAGRLLKGGLLQLSKDLNVSLQVAGSKHQDMCDNGCDLALGKLCDARALQAALAN